MYDIEISEMTRNSDTVFDEMITWLRANVGDQLTESRRDAEHIDGNYHRKYTIDGDGWKYEYHVIRVPVGDGNHCIDANKFKYVGMKAGGSFMYVSKRFYIEDAIRAVEFKLKW